MAKLNVFAKEGTLPTFDCYQTTAKEIEEKCRQILIDQFGLNRKVYVSQEEEGDPTCVRMEIEDAETIEEEHERIYEKMIDAGLQPTEDSDVYNYFTFMMGGGSDGWLYWLGNTDEDGNEMLFYMTNTRRDVKKQILKVMKIALEGDRDETVRALNKMKKKVCH